VNIASAKTFTKFDTIPMMEKTFQLNMTEEHQRVNNAGSSPKAQSSCLSPLTFVTV